jgi:RES domain-containing protein
MSIPCHQRRGRRQPGGRFNRPGTEALYLSRAPQTALEEYRQGASIAPPATLAAYRVTIGEVVDLTGGYDPAVWSAEWAEWDCPWKEIAHIRGGTPPSWRLGDMLIAERCRTSSKTTANRVGAKFRSR